MKALAIGEVLWDVIGENEYLGGAPFNVTAHLARQGFETYLISAVGQDNRGDRIIEEARKLNVGTEFIINNDKPTGTVDVTLNQGQPSYTINEGVAWDHLDLSAELLTKVTHTSWDCLILGTLAQRSDENKVFYQAILEQQNATEVFYDVNLRKDYFSKSIFERSMEAASILKLNDEEVDPICQTLYGSQFTQRDAVERLSKDFKIPVICTTLGSKGALIFQEDEFTMVPGVKIKVADTIGAGDSFSAAFISTFLKTKNATLAGEKGCALGGFVASQNGAVPTYSPEIQEVLNIEY